MGKDTPHRTCSTHELIAFQSHHAPSRRNKAEERDRDNSRTTAMSWTDPEVDFILVCSICKRYKSEEGAWRTSVPQDQSLPESRISHGCCPDCATRNYGTYLR